MTTDYCPSIPMGYTHIQGNWHEYTRDEHGRELAYRDNLNKWRAITRDEDGNILTYVDNCGRWYKYEYGPNGVIKDYKEGRYDLFGDRVGPER
jgi:hypothetical protein